MTDDQVTYNPLPLDPFHLRIYVDEALFKVQFARQAWNLVQLSKHSGNQYEIWYHLESLAGSITSVANLFWPTRKGFPLKRAVELRNRLNLSTELDSTIREVRNGYIHFDERIDKYIVIPGSFTYIDRNQSPREYIGLGPLEHIGRNFDISSWELSIFGSVTALDEAMLALDAVADSCRIWLNENDPYQR